MTHARSETTRGAADASSLSLPQVGELIPFDIVAANFGVSVATVKNWSRRPGGLASWRVGKGLYTTSTALAAFVEAGKQAGPGAVAGA